MMGCKQHVLQRTFMHHVLLLSMVVLTSCGVPSVASTSGTTSETTVAFASTSAVSASPSTTASAVAQEIKVFGDDSAFPSTCTPRIVAQTLMQFMDAVEAGDEQQLDTLVSPRFEWYREIVDADPNSSRNFTLNGAPEVIKYLALRHQQQERIELREARVLGYEAPEDIVQATILVTRHANDLDPRWGGDEHLGYGRTVIDCAEPAIKMWSVSSIFFDPTDTSKRFGAPCAPMSRNQPAEVISVCSEDAWQKDE